MSSISATAFRGRATQTRATAQARLLDVPKGRTIVVDGLALGVLPEAARSFARETRCSRWCTIRWRWRPGLSAQDDADIARQRTRGAGGRATHVVVTSAATARLLVEDYERRRPNASPSHARAPIRGAQRKEAATASCACCRSAQSCRARASTC